MRKICQWWIRRLSLQFEGSLRYQRITETGTCLKVSFLWNRRNDPGNRIRAVRSGQINCRRKAGLVQQHLLFEREKSKIKKLPPINRRPHFKANAAKVSQIELWIRRSNMGRFYAVWCGSERLVAQWSANSRNKELKPRMAIEIIRRALIRTDIDMA